MALTVVVVIGFVVQIRTCHASGSTWSVPSPTLRRHLYPGLGTPGREKKRKNGAVIIISSIWTPRQDKFILILQHPNLGVCLIEKFS